MVRVIEGNARQDMERELCVKTLERNVHQGMEQKVHYENGKEM